MSTYRMLRAKGRRYNAATGSLRASAVTFKRDRQCSLAGGMQNNGAVVDAETPQRRFQFSLRKLMIWMAVVAVYLSIMRWGGYEAPNTIFFGLWIGVIVAIRTQLGFGRGLRVTGCFFPVLALGVGALRFWLDARQPREDPPTAFMAGLARVNVALFLSPFFFLFTWWLVWFVNKLDAPLQTKTPQATDNCGNQTPPPDAAPREE